MADNSVFSTAGRTPSAQMDADLSTLHAPEAAAEVVDEGCRRVRERGQIDIVGSATCIDTATSAWQFVERPILAAGSTARRNTFRGRVCWGFVYQRPSGFFFELPNHSAE